MSIKVMTQVWERQAEGSEQALLLALADHADDDGEHIFPSIARLAWKTSYSHRNIQYLMKGLRDRGVLIVVRPASRGRPTEYKLNLDALPAKPPFRQPLKLTSARRRTVIETFEYICQYCLKSGNKLTGPDGIAWEVDRIIPGKHSGDYGEDNVTLACYTCNRAKGAEIAPQRAITLVDRGASYKHRGARPTNRGAKVISREPSLEPSPEPGAVKIEDRLRELRESYKDDGS